MIKLENILIAVYGISTVILFIVMVAVGGLFDSIHTVLFREISFIISPYSFNEGITIPLYRIYNIDLFIFSLIIFIRMHNIFVKLGALYLSLSAIMGIILLQFPMDPIGISDSLSGFTHIFFVLIIVFYISVALTLISYGLKNNKNLLMLSKYSFEISIIIMLAGFLTGIFAWMSMPVYVGLFQKLPVLAFLVWILLTSWLMMKSDNRVRYAVRTKTKRIHKVRRLRT